MVSRIDLSSGSLGFVDDPSSAIPISSPPPRPFFFVSLLLLLSPENRAFQLLVIFKFNTINGNSNKDNNSSTSNKQEIGIFTSFSNERPSFPSRPRWRRRINQLSLSAPMNDYAKLSIDHISKWSEMHYRDDVVVVVRPVVWRWSQLIK